MPRVRILESAKSKKNNNAGAADDAEGGAAVTTSILHGHWDDTNHNNNNNNNNNTSLDIILDERDNDHVGQHPALRDLSIMNTQTKLRIVPNSMGPSCDLCNDCFDGRVMLLIRTPDVDGEDYNNTSCSVEELGLCETAQKMSRYFADKKRRFEFQFQIKLKKIPTGPLFLGCELEQPIKIGAITKGLVGILLAMVRRINPGFHHAWGNHTVSDDDRATGSWEKSHLSFPVENSMDRIVITKPGDQPPTLGDELMESNESVKRRRKMGPGAVDWNLEDTYTMCLWSAYCDWIKWKSLNVPGVAPFLLSRVTGTQPIYLSVYEISNIDPQEYRKRRGVPHFRKDLNVYTRLEFAHQYHTTGGLAEKLLGKSMKTGLLAAGNSSSAEQSLPDTEQSLDDSDFETASRATV